MRLLLRFALLLSVSFVCGPTAIHSEEKEKLLLNVQGMHCASCVSMIKKSVRKVTGVESVAIDLDRGSVEIECDAVAVRRESIEGAIRRMGYRIADSDSLTRPPQHE